MIFTVSTNNYYQTDNACYIKCRVLLLQWVFIAPACWAASVAAALAGAAYAAGAMFLPCVRVYSSLASGAAIVVIHAVCHN